MATSARRRASHAIATVGRLARHLALLAEAKAALAGVDLEAGVLKPGVRRSLQRALAYTPDRLDRPTRRRKRR